MIYDKRAATNVLACLMKNPELFNNIDKYSFDTGDFKLPFHRLVFSSIFNLYHQGVEKINIQDIIDYIGKYPELLVLFNNNQGSEFLLTLEESAELENFDFYYDRLKKLSLLQLLKEKGFPIGDWYEDGVYDIAKRQILEKKLEVASLMEILNSIQGKFNDIESLFLNKKTFHYGKAADSIEDLLSTLKTTPEMGFPLQGKIFSTINRGARKTKLYLMSAGTGMGKSRLAVGNACCLAFPIRWNKNKQEWEKFGSNQKILFITTELQIDEIQSMIVAYISGINEETILNGTHTKEELKREQEAIKIIKEYSDNFHILHMPDPNIDQLNSNVRKMVVNKKIDALFYDYIHTSTALITEYSGAKIREDVALLLVTNALKNLANELGIFVWSGTQFNASAAEIDFIDESCLRGSRAIADKIDFGCGIQRPTKEDLKKVSNIIKAKGIEPNAYLDIYKNRRSQYRRCRLWVNLDLGCCRVDDLFLTDEWGVELPIDLVYLSDSSVAPDVIEILKKQEPEPEIFKNPPQFDISNITL